MAVAVVQKHILKGSDYMFRDPKEIRRAWVHKQGCRVS
jgi:hypothetical protein